MGGLNRESNQHERGTIFPNAIWERVHGLWARKVLRSRRACVMIPLGGHARPCSRYVLEP